jgi:hypothetical protein
MGLHLAYGNQDHRRARIEGEIQQRTSSLRKIGQDRIDLAARLAANRTLQRMIALRFKQSGLMADRSESRNRKCG